jgi:hypothetical protein
MRNYYKVLGISENASTKEIKEAYHKLIKQWHPDRNPHTPISDDMMKMYNEAYEVLSDTEKRTNYDISIGKQSNHTDSEQTDYTHQERYESETHQKSKDESITRSYRWLSTRIASAKSYSRTNRIIWKNFIVSVLLLLGFCILWIVKYIIDPSPILNANYDTSIWRHGFPAIVGTLIVICSELIFWVLFFLEKVKNLQIFQGSQMLAGCIGILLCMNPFSGVLVVADWYPVVYWIFLLYVGISHIVFSIVGREDFG